MAMFLTAVFIPHLAEQNPNHCFQTFASSERAPVKLFIGGLHPSQQMITKQHMHPSKVTGLSFLNVATSKIGQEKHNRMF